MADIWKEESSLKSKIFSTKEELEAESKEKTYRPVKDPKDAKPKAKDQHE